jgi:hypothetical protein
VKSVAVSHVEQPGAGVPSPLVRDRDGFIDSRVWLYAGRAHVIERA